MTAAILLAAPAAANEAKIEHLGLELIGNLELAGGELGSERAVVLIVPDALAVHSTDGPRTLQAGLVGHRIPSLAVTLSLGMDVRRKPFDCGFDHDHRDSDAALEIAAWVQWLVAQGARAVVLVGEGRGALQVALEAPTQDSGNRPSADPAPVPAVRGLVVIAPSPSDAPSRAADYRSRYGTDLGPVLAEAHRVGRESGEDISIDVPGFLGCRRARATAGAFLDAYDPERAPDLVRLVRMRGRPTLAFLPPDDPRRVALSAVTALGAGGATLRIEMLSTDPGRPDILAQAGTAARIAAFINGLAR